jgi:hypothetical protein
MMEHIDLILILLALITWKIFFSRYRIILSSPIFRNTTTKELGCWAYLTINIPFPPFPGLVVHDGKGGIYRIRKMQWDKGDRTITCDTYYADPICDYNDDESYDHIKKCAAEEGWKLREVPPGHILGWWEEEYEDRDEKRRG